MYTSRSAMDQGSDPLMATRQFPAVNPVFKYAFISIITAGLVFVGIHLGQDLDKVPPLSVWSYVMLGAALLIALGFEFVNGFHDTANAVATVIYTNSLPAHAAVIWAGLFNFLGVMLASGAVAYGILGLLPVDLILNVGSSAGFAMIFALLLAAIIWNLGTWYFGIPASSSHTMVGSILGVGLMNQLMHSSMQGTSGVDVEQMMKVGKALFFSPLIGFSIAALLFLLVKVFLKRHLELFKAPEGDKPPPFLIRALLILTCTGVSFAHGSNDGQKGMGLIMLILIGVVPLAYSLNQTMDTKTVQSFIAVSDKASHVLDPANQMDTDSAKRVLKRYLETKKATADVVPAVGAIAENLSSQVGVHRRLDGLPELTTQNLRNEMYLSSASLKLLDKQKAMPALNDADKAMVKDYRDKLDKATQYIPMWVKVAIALALGLGTMVGWKRIVVTVGEKIGKNHMTYAQGMSAELVAMSTILAADSLGVPVSTTHVLNSAVTGTMAANKSGLQWQTIRSILMAWILTLPAAMGLSAGLYWLFMKLI